MSKTRKDKKNRIQKLIVNEKEINRNFKLNKTFLWDSFSKPFPKGQN